MKTGNTFPFSLALLLLVGSGVSAQVESGPLAGSEAKPVKAVALVKDEADKEKDFVAERAGKPTVFLFVQADKFDRPVVRFMRTLDQDLVKNREDVHVVAVWLTDDVDMSKKYVPRVRVAEARADYLLSFSRREERPGWLGHQRRCPPDGCRRGEG